MDKQPTHPPQTSTPAKKTGTKIWRALLISLLGGVAGLLILPILASWLLRLDGVQHGLISAIESSLEQPDSRVKIQGLTGILPFDMRLDSLQWLDANGVWLAIEQGAVTLSLQNLLDGEITIQKLTAQRIALLRPPVSEPTTPTHQTAPSKTPFKRPPFLPRITVDRLQVAQLELNQTFGGSEAARFQLSGHMTAQPDGSGSLEIALTRTDQTGTDLTIKAAMDHTQSIKLAASLQDQSGYLAPLLGGTHHEVLQLSLAGEGPLDQWRGSVDLTYPALGTTQMGLTLDIAHPLTAALQGMWQPPKGMLPQELHKIIGDDSIPVTANLHFNPDNHQLNLTALAIDKEPFQLTGTAQAEWVTQTLQGALQLQINQLAPLSDLVGKPLSGAMHVTADLKGSLTAPQMVINVTSDALSIEQNRIQGLALTMNITPPTEATHGTTLPAGVVLTAKGNAQSITLPDPPQGMPSLRPQFNLTARFATSKTLEVEQLAINNGESLTMTAQGSLQLTNGAGRFTGQTKMARLAELTKSLPYPIQGEANVQLDGVLAEAWDQIDFQAMVTTNHLSGLPPVAILLGPAPTLRLQGVVQPGKKVQLSQIQLQGQQVTLQGQAGVDLRQKTLLTTNATLQVADLAPLSKIAGKQLAGKAEGTTHLHGLLAAPKADLQITLHELNVDQLTLQTVTLTGDGSNLNQKPTGSFTLVAVQPQGELSLKSRYQLTDAHLLALDNLLLQGPKTQLAGNLQADLKTSRINGQLKGKIEDLAALKAWHQESIRGLVELDITLETGKDGIPKGHMTGKALHLAGDFGQLDALQVNGKASLRANKPVIDAQLELTRLQHNGLKLASLKAHAEGTLEKIDFETHGKGVAKWPFSLDINGKLTRKSDLIQLDITRLNGSLDKEPIKLSKTLTLIAQNETLLLKPLELTFGEATLQGEMHQTSKQIEATFTSQGDLAILHRLGLYPIRGATRLHALLQGDTQHPDLTITLALKQGKPLAPALKQLPPLDLTLTGTLHKGNHLAVDFVSHGFTQGDMKGHAELPLRLSLQPLLVDLSSTKKISSTLQAEIKLADIGKWLAWEEQQRLEGLMVMDLTASGTLDHPQLNGTITMEDGLFEHADAGTSLHQIQMLVKATNDVVVLDYLTATDGEKGIVQATGQMQLDSAHHFPLALHLQMAHAFLVRRDDALANLSGDLRVKGNLETLLVTGDVTVNQAEYYLPKASGPDITVVKMNETVQQETTTKTSAPSSLQTKLDIDLNIPARSFVRGHGLDSEWQGALRITGELQTPLIAGQLRIKRGQLDLLDRRFQLTTGLLDFNATWPPEPTIELEATVQRAEILTRIGVEGVVTKPKITLSSEPIMSEDEILSHLLFDRTTDSITPTQALKLAVTLKNLQSGGPSLIGNVQRELGIDRLEVGGDSVETGSVSAGKYLTDDIYLEVEKGLKADSGRINVEVEMTPRLFLKTGVDAKSNGDIGVQWKKDY